MNDMAPDQNNPESDTPSELMAQLGQKDAAALDALVEAGMDPGVVGAEYQQRAEHVASLLALLRQTDVSDGDSLIDVTLARVSRASIAEAAELSRADESALQAWILAGYNAKKTPGALRARAEQLEALQTQITAVSLESSAESLIERTLARVESDEDARSDRMNFETQSFRRGFGVRLADVVSVAAVLLVGAAVMWPLLTALRQSGQRTACYGNLNAAGMGFATYANDNLDRLPVAGTEFAGPWWNTGTPNQSNSAHLFKMVRTKHVELDDLACAGNPGATRGDADPDASDWASRQNVSYSYQIMSGPAMATWSGHESQAVMADRSPVVDVWVEGEPFYPMTNSRNHDGRGQHTLMTDSSAQWLKTPETASGDNIWLPRSIEQFIEKLTARDRNRAQKPLTGTETAESARDVFLGP